MDLDARRRVGRYAGVEGSRKDGKECPSTRKEKKVGQLQTMAAVECHRRKSQQDECTAPPPMVRVRCSWLLEEMGKGWERVSMRIICLFKKGEEKGEGRREKDECVAPEHVG